LTDKNGGYVYDTPPPPNLSGLALALGFNSVKEMLSYKGPLKKQISCLITKCEDLIQLRLYDKDTLNGAKFTLTSCFEGWSGKTDETEKELDALVSGLIEEIDNEAIG